MNLRGLRSFSGQNGNILEASNKKKKKQPRKSPSICKLSNMKKIAYWSKKKSQEDLENILN